MQLVEMGRSERHPEYQFFIEGQEDVTLLTIAMSHDPRGFKAQSWIRRLIFPSARRSYDQLRTLDDELLIAEATLDTLQPTADHKVSLTTASSEVALNSLRSYATILRKRLQPNSSTCRLSLQECELLESTLTIIETADEVASRAA